MQDTVNTQVMVYVVLAFAVAGIVSFGASPLVKRFARMVGAVDVPGDERRVHKKPITRLGGLAIFLGFLAAVLIFNDLGPQIRGVMIGAIIIVMLGVLDDIAHLKAWIKLIGQITAALVPAMAGVVIQTLSDPRFFFRDGAPPYFELGAWSVPVTVVWIVLITNSVNLIDGLDGLAVGVSSIASLSMLIIAVALMIPDVAILMAALAGACVGFMPYNLNPAKMFMGDTGALFLGYILATSSILGLFKFYALISFAVPFLVLALPIFDTAAAIVRRLSKGRNPMSPDRSHVHHRLMDMGFTQKQAVAILYAMSAVLGMTAVMLTTAGEIKAIILLVAALIALGVGLRVSMPPGSSRPPDGPDGAGDDNAPDGSGDAANNGESEERDD
ncbi:MAG: undecaprenyl/decaprenyl-phosphate alpha-N-acetylglucosaminyl 1-phosphate transferase [Oscillospiraceae bacterium]|nr:undecaprenyl/decaprenyl-phosphate alpha-N-acetylglucosaminyl 1-phosphate transferase [Oscillospiraceae bacterium]